MVSHLKREGNCGRCACMLLTSRTAGPKLFVALVNFGHFESMFISFGTHKRRRFTALPAKIIKFLE